MTRALLLLLGTLVAGCLLPPADALYPDEDTGAADDDDSAAPDDDDSAEVP